MFYGREFLDELFLNKDRELYVRITLLTWDELKIKEIQGLVVDGSLNVDGNSIIRRSLNLNMALDEDSFYLHETVHSITISRKIQVHIGLKNNTYYGRFPDSVSNDLRFLAEPIIWFNLGVFVPTDVSLVHDIENSSISISAQDKMVLLNGDISGQLGYDIDFINTITQVDLPYRTIIKDAVSYFGGIDESKVLVLDVPFYAESLTTVPSEDFTYVGSGAAGTNIINFDISISLTNLLVGQELIQVFSGEAGEGALTASTTVSSISSNSITISKNIAQSGGIIFYASPAVFLYSTNVGSYGKRTFNISDGSIITSGTLLSPPIDPGNILPLQFTLSPKNKETAIEVSSTDNVTTILEKVKSDLLGQYEYFFDVDGNFIFQFLRNLESEFNSSDIFQNDAGNKYLADFSSIPYVYDFSDKEIISSYNNTPNWKGIKNDFYVYGAKNLLYHLAIDSIPKVPSEFYEKLPSGVWSTNLVPYNQPWQQYIIDLTEYNTQENPSVPENKYYAELKKYFEYNAEDNTGIYWKLTPTSGLWRSGNTGETLDYRLILNFTFQLEYLVIAGGAGGGSGPAGSLFDYSGGGGAGGYRSSVAGEKSGQNSSAESKSSITIGSTYTITVGAGGAGGAAGSYVNGTNGENSIFGTITSTGGGGGGRGNDIGSSGGSGGGGGGGSLKAGGSGTANQGTAGGNGSSALAHGGGGGGAFQSGISATSTKAGNGGVGLTSSITGTEIIRAGGGGGATSGDSTAWGRGGTGGGGDGALFGSNVTSGSTNTGGGGGGGAGTSGAGVAGGNGGSGIVVLRYPSNIQDISSISGGLTYTRTTYDSFKVYIFTAGTGTITF
jgi:hypothetical protein